MLGRSLARLATLAAFAALPCAVGCSVAGGGDAASSSDAVTEVPETPVKDQSIGNCWTYGTMSWAESLVKRAGGGDKNLSESYVNYWWWYVQIAQSGGAPTVTLNEGGSWGMAAELMTYYGLMEEGTFIPEEAAAARSGRQASALAAIRASLESGDLKTPEARMDGAKVRAALDKAWGLSPKVIKYLDDTFGKDGAGNLLVSSVPDGVPILRTKDLPAKLTNPETGALDTVTLADAIGEAKDPTTSYEVRTGKYAWSETAYPTDAKARRDFLKRVQRALHDSQPVVLSWYVDFNAMDGQGSFKAPPATPGAQGSHLVVLYDYEVTNVPGFGTLPAGKLETRPDALKAALSDDAQVTFLRAKNSWGVFGTPVVAGYDDLYMKYLNGPLKECETDANEKPILDKCHDATPLQSAVFPAGI